MAASVQYWFIQWRRAVETSGRGSVAAYNAYQRFLASQGSRT